MDVNHDGLLSLSEVATTRNTPYWSLGSLPGKILVDNSAAGVYQFIKGLEAREVNIGDKKQEAVDIDTTVGAFLEQRFQSIFVDTKDKSCPYLGVGCPPMMRSFADMDNLSVIGHLNSTGILLIQGGRDIGQSPEQAFMLVQKLQEVNHPEHTIIVYPGYGHGLINIGKDSWIDRPGLLPDYLMEDMYSWLTDHDRNWHRHT